MEKKCKSCGHVIKDAPADYRICPKCGGKLEEREGRQTIPRQLRHAVFKRDSYRCRECGASKDETTLEIDHIIPVSKGGTNDIDNLQTLCRECNRKKHADEWIAGETDIETLQEVINSLKNQINHYKELLKQASTEDEEIECEYELIQLKDKLSDAQQEYEKKKEEIEEAKKQRKLEEKIDKLYKKAIVREKQGKYEEAIECYEELIRLDPNNMEYQDKLPRLKYEFKEKKRKCKYYYKETIKAEQKGNYHLAVDNCKKALEFDPYNIDYKNKLQELQSELEKIQIMGKSYPKAQELEQEGNYQEAIKYYEDLIELNPNYDRYQYVLLSLEEKQQRLKEAEEQYYKLTEEEKQNRLEEANKQYNKAINEENHKKYEEAVKYCREAISLNPTNVEYKKKLYELEIQIEQYYKETMKKLEKEIELAYELKHTYSAYFESFEYNYEFSLCKYNIEEKLNESKEQYYKLTGEEREQRLKEAGKQCNNAIEEENSHNPQEAIMYYMKAIILNPFNERYKKKLRELEEQREKYCQETLENLSKLHDAHRSFANKLEEQYRYQEALVYWLKARSSLENYFHEHDSGLRMINGMEYFPNRILPFYDDEVNSIIEKILEQFYQKIVRLHEVKQYKKSLFWCDKLIEIINEPLKRERIDFETFKIIVLETYSKKLECLKKLGRTEEAKKCYNKFKKKYPDYKKDYLAKKIRTKQKYGYYKEAIEYCKIAIRLEPNNIEYKNKLQEIQEIQNKQKSKEHYHKAKELETQKKYEEAIKTINNAIQLDPTNKKYKNKLQTLKQKAKSKEHYHKAKELETQKKYEEAIKTINNAIQLDPTNKEYKNKLQEIKNKQKAKEYYEKTIKVEKQRKYYDAIDYCEKAIQLDPTNKEYKNKLQEIKNKLQEIKNKQKAKEYYQKTLTTDKQGNYDEAINIIKKARQLDPTNKEYKNKLQELQKQENKRKSKEYYYKALRFEKVGSKSAIDYCEKAIQLDPTNKEYKNKLQELQKQEAKNYYKKALQLEKQKKFKEAIDYCEKAIQLDPTNKEYKNKLQEIKNKLQEIKNKQKAKNYYKKALQLEKQKRYQKAIKYCNKAIQLDPTNKEYKNKLQEIKNKKEKAYSQYIEDEEKSYHHSNRDTRDLIEDYRYHKDLYG